MVSLGGTWGAVTDRKCVYHRVRFLGTPKSTTNLLLPLLYTEKDPELDTRSVLTQWDTVMTGGYG